MGHQHTLNEKNNYSWNWQYLALQSYWHILNCLWMSWMGWRWGWAPPQRGGTVAGVLCPQASCRAGMSCLQAQPQLFPNEPWLEPGSCPKIPSQASYDIPGKVTFSVWWKFVLISSDACRFHTFLCVCVMLNIHSSLQMSWSYFNQQNQRFALVKTEVILPT